MSTERDLASSAVVAAAAEVINEAGDGPAGASSPTVASTASDATGAQGNTATDAGRRWIKEMKAGDKVIGYVADTTKFAAFVDCSVVRRGAKVCVLCVRVQISVCVCTHHISSLRKSN